MTHKCSFCDKDSTQVGKLIISGDAGICDECVLLSAAILTKGSNERVRKDLKISKALDPVKIKEYLDSYIVGQDSAKIALSVGVVNHYKRIFFESAVELEKSNILLFGPTGSGKTLLAKTIAKYLDLPFVIADATTLTEAGYVGDDVESVIGRLFSEAGNDVERCQQGIVFLDEVDKISRKSESPTLVRDVSGEGVQQALLKLVEGTKCMVTVSGSKRHPALEQVEIDTSKILFIAGGAFIDLDRILENRLGGTSIGFQTVEVEDFDRSKATPEDFVSYGMIPEFCGRFPIMVSIDKLELPDLVNILTVPKNNPIAQMRFYFESDGVELEFTPESITAVAEKAQALRVGARGLRSILEKALIPYMYSIQGIKNQGFKKMQVTADLINNGAPPNFT